MGKFIVLGVIVVSALGWYFWAGPGSVPAAKAPAAMSGDANVKSTGETKEFTTTAYYDDTGVWYSLKEMRVKLGDKVRVKATNTRGMHDFNIDELGVKQELPLNQEVAIEFMANKVGSFVFYCSKPGHRAKGQWGTLIVEN